MRRFSQLIVFLFKFALLILLSSGAVDSIHHCVEHGQSSLLHLKHSLVFDHRPADWRSNLETWNSTSDCCLWDGVVCNADGHVISLLLDGESISGGIDDSNSPLFDLRHLRLLDLSYNNFHGTQIPSGIGKLVNLHHLQLSSSNFGGQVPIELSCLTSLLTLDLSLNNFLPGTVPNSIHNLKSLTDLFLQSSGLAGTITDILWENLHNLSYVDLSNNALTGSIPLSLFSLPSLKILYLSWNQLVGLIEELPSSSSSSALETLSLHRNNLVGPIPTSIFYLESLVEIYLSHNNFNGTIDLTSLFHNLTSNISAIDLSFNDLTIVESADSIGYSSLPHHLTDISLVSCNLKAFPRFLMNQSMLQFLDLSCNKIQGKIPSWIWKPTLSDLNLSHNSLRGFQTLLQNLTSEHALNYLDLSSNLLQGQIPFLHRASYLDYSSNNFNSVIPDDIGNHLSATEFLFLSNNDLHGTIPLSICNILTSIRSVVDLSNNSLSGVIPPCLVATRVAVLNLRSNNLSGNIPDAFEDSCALQTLDVSGNRLQGRVPGSMVNCEELEVVNLGNNELNGGFPCWLMQLSKMRVLVLRSNKLYGPITCALGTSSWPNLQIIDIAVNNFGGELPYESIKTWTAMMAQRGTVQPNFDPLGSQHYLDSVTIVSKGHYIELVKILTIFNSVDFSCNNFEGSIPQSIGGLISLLALNLSHNRFTGQIPLSLGYLKELESLDLANNSLSGVIPEQLASLNFLSYLNLSFNQLVGKIQQAPNCNHFQNGLMQETKGFMDRL